MLQPRRPTRSERWTLAAAVDDAVGCCSRSRTHAASAERGDTQAVAASSSSSTREMLGLIGEKAKLVGALRKVRLDARRLSCMSTAELRYVARAR